nr:glutamate-cysteine ligase family protein [Mycobacterium sp.]
MTFVVTSEPEPAPCGSGADDGALASSTSAGLRIADACLSDGPLGQVGLELEAHCYDLADPARRPEWAELTAVIADVPELPGGSAITVEPGGAVELS